MRVGADDSASRLHRQTEAGAHCGRAADETDRHLLERPADAIDIEAQGYRSERVFGEDHDADPIAAAPLDQFAADLFQSGDPG